MEEILYLLLVSDEACDAVANYLGYEDCPDWVRLSTMSPLSNYGIPENGKGTVLAVRPEGLLIGVLNQTTPRLFVPWTNVGYLGDGDALVNEKIASG
jgi:hypothetical protein